jgi:hypothetical protein
VAVFVRVTPLSSQVRAWIEQAKELYVDRQAQDAEPEQKNGRAKRASKKNSRKIAT